MIDGLELRPDQSAALGEGAFDGDQVWVEFLTQEDAHVRPAHAALHGTVWSADDPNAPAPPLDYGCRCQLRYVAKPNTLAAHVFPVAEVVPVPRADVFAAYLDKHVPQWPKVAAAAAQAQPAERLSVAYLTLKRLYPNLGADTRDLARMAVEAAPKPATVAPVAAGGSVPAAVAGAEAGRG
ncbi:minor capsid protein [Methylibium sp.]|uniref:minor capsid protein n=1 Tax=Methylibium sp. TaxID=2067992 RepID=UPI0025F73F1F|nr:minor capsid protein [Methylibium sp.]